MNECISSDTEFGLFKMDYGKRGAFSLGQSQLEILINYIDRQHEHHNNLTFEDEFLNFLKKYKIEYDEQYLWD